MSDPSSSFYLIVNPNAGSSNFSKSWNKIQEVLKEYDISYSYSFTQYTKHEILLAKEAIKQGFRKIISVGGDGTLHHVLNGVMRQRYIKTSDIKLGVIPIGTGNDWIKTYNIPNSIEKSIAIVKEEFMDYQDIGCIDLSNTEEYFINLAGIGYDGYVVNQLKSLKRFGSIAYLLSGLKGLLFYKKSTYTITINNHVLEEKCLMVLVGICQYSGGGMQMTKASNPKDGFFDITVAKNFSFFDLIVNLPKLYNGKIVNHKKVENYKATEIKVEEKESNSFIEADGELLGKKPLNIHLKKQAIQIIIPEKLKKS